MFHGTVTPAAALTWTIRDVAATASPRREVLEAGPLEISPEEHLARAGLGNFGLFEQKIISRGLVTGARSEENLTVCR